VVTGAVPDLGPSKPARVHTKHDAPRRKPPERTASPVRREPPVVAKAAFQATPRSTPKPAPTPRAKPKATAARTRRKAAAREAAPREFGFENQAPTGGTAEPSATTATSTQAPPQPTSTKPLSSKKFSPAEQEFAP
jgi:hypothetical protein